jgi:Subtilase family
VIHFIPCLESLEERMLLSLVPQSYTPADLSLLYNLPRISASSVTVAVIGVGMPPDLASQLANWCNIYNLPQPHLTVFGDTHTPPPYSSFALEAIMDCCVLASVARGVNIDYFAAYSTAPNPWHLVPGPVGNAEFLYAAQAAAATPGVSVVSMSLGCAKLDNTFDSLWSTPHVSFVAASGDYAVTGQPGAASILYPASDPNVLSVGGTTENEVNGVITYESLWALSAEPAVLQLLADPHTDVAGFGGTSLACPIAAGMVALGDALRLSHGYPALSSPDLVSTILNLPNADFRDGASRLTPDMTRVVNLMGGPSHFGVFDSPYTQAGIAAPVIVEALDDNNDLVAAWTGNVVFLLTDQAATTPPTATMMGGRCLVWVSWQTPGTQAVIALGALDTGYALETVL